MAVVAVDQRPADPEREDGRVRLRAKERPTYRITFRPLPGVDGDRAIRALLKRALRSHGLQATLITETPDLE